MSNKTMVDLRKWRQRISIDTPIVTRDAVKGIIVKVNDDKCRIMFGKGHEKNEDLDDLFPIDWEDLIVEWRNKKVFRETDIPIGEAEESK